MKGGELTVPAHKNVSLYQTILGYCASPNEVTWLQSYQQPRLCDVTCSSQTY